MNMTDSVTKQPGGWWGRLRRPRLTSGVLLGFAIYALLLTFTGLPWRIRFIAAWDIGVTFVLAALFIGLRKSSAQAIKHRALRQDGGKWAVLILSLFAATASLVVIASEMPLVKNASGFEQTLRVFFVVDHDRAVMGVHAHDVRAPLRARLLHGGRPVTR